MSLNFPMPMQFIPSFRHLILSTARRPLNSKGHSFSTIQATINDLAGDGWIYIPSGTYNEALTITNDNVIMFSTGRSTIINGGITGHAVNVSGDYVFLRDFAVQTTQGQANLYDCIYSTGNYLRGRNIVVLASDNYGLHLRGHYAVIIAPDIRDTDLHGVQIHGRTSLSFGFIALTGGHNVIIQSLGDNSRITGMDLGTAGDDGVYIVASAEDCVIDGCRIQGYTNEAIDDDSGTSIIGDNDTTV